ncbi:MAG: hypothetical protein STSR0009_17690 [Methanoregula sp.]
MFAGVEKVKINPNSPLQKYIIFSSYPDSLSLLISTIISCVAGVGIAIFTTPLAGILFVICSASHWFLDTIVHQRDLPVLGVAHDIKEGLGLWNYPKSGFVLEYALYVGVTLLVMPMPVAVPLIIIGSIFHLVNANSFFGFTKSNPFKTAHSYAVLTLLGFVFFIFAVLAVLG